MTEPLIEASHIRFNGMTKDSLDDPPALDEAVVYRVQARCIKHEQARRDDGEIRRVAVMKVEDVTVMAGAAINDDAGPSLFDEEEAADEDPEQDGAHVYPIFTGDEK